MPRPPRRAPARFAWPLPVLLLAACAARPPAEEAPVPDSAVEAPDAAPAPAEITVRVATFNAALNRPAAGALAAELDAGSAQARAVAEIIQRTAPDVLLLQEFDYDPAALDVFRARYLGVSQNGAPAIDYAHSYAVPSNTGVSAGVDIDGDDAVDGPGDAHGFGQFAGQYAFAVLSRWPIDREAIRTLQTLRWSSMPQARAPRVPETDAPYYSAEAWAVLRLSSKNHVDVPIHIGGRALHLLAAHPTPPVFDGPEDRNGQRNADEIRLFADYIDPERSGWIVDDAGVSGGLAADAAFVIAGDMNADPVDGDSADGAIAQLLAHPRVHTAAASGAQVPRSEGGRANGPQPDQQGDPAHDTAGWGLRVDYVLPSAGLEVIATGVFWPTADDDHGALVAREGDRDVSSDHRLVWVDLRWPGPVESGTTD